MARGKYSPTVTAAYQADQQWWEKHTREAYPAYDADGYDSYGYNADGYDRAGNHENDYAHNDGDYDRDEDYNLAHEQVTRDWGFNGVSPYLKTGQK